MASYEIAQQRAFLQTFLIKENFVYDINKYSQVSS